jgi:hypothetical protein
MPSLESACLPFQCAERINLQLSAQARQPELLLGESMQPPWLLLTLALSSCPLGFYGSGNYCVSSPSNDREAIQKTGNSCPLGWFSSGSYCVKSR